MQMIILVGNIGSGKSTYAKNLACSDKVMINQDILGSRQDCIETAEFYMSGFTNLVIIDRTNINKKQRSYWINLAKKHNYEVEVVEFRVDPELAFERVKNRPDHPTIKNCSDEKIRSIIKRFSDSYEVPDFSEGFFKHTIIVVDRSKSTSSTLYCLRD